MTLRFTKENLEDIEKGICPVCSGKSLKEFGFKDCPSCKGTGKLSLVSLSSEDQGKESQKEN